MSTLNAFSDKERVYHPCPSRQEALHVQRAVAWELEEPRAGREPPSRGSFIRDTLRIEPPASPGVRIEWPGATLP
jgi:hypothetical protein